jgi:hypothetical protein
MAHHAIGAALLGAGAGGAADDVIHILPPRNATNPSANLNPMTVGIAVGSLAAAGLGIALLLQSEPPGHGLSAWNWVGVGAATLSGAALAEGLNFGYAWSHVVWNLPDIAAGAMTPSHRAVASPALAVSAPGIL